MNGQADIKLKKGDALIIVDVQNDFLPGGNLAVPYGDRVVPVLNRYIRIFNRSGLPIFASRDWHPANHCSFKDQGGVWPPHCIAESEGAKFASELKLPKHTIVISKATMPEAEALSSFAGTHLEETLRGRRIRRLFIGGLATDYCVLNTVQDAFEYKYTVFLLEDAIQAVNICPNDGREAVKKMLSLGATAIRMEDLLA